MDICIIKGPLAISLTGAPATFHIAVALSPPLPPLLFLPLPSAPFKLLLISKAHYFIMSLP